MAGNFFNIDDDKLERLREEVCRLFGRKLLSHRDAIELSNQILSKPNLSTQTIKRFFGLIKDETKPSIDTLNILCSYLGYSGWDGFVDRSSVFLGRILEVRSVSTGIDFYLKDIPSYWEEHYYRCRDKAFEFHAMPDNNYKEHLFIELGKVKNAHDTFWEWFPNLNALRAIPYKKGLESYKNSNETNDASCYANSMLFLGSYLSKRSDEAEYYAGLLKKIIDVDSVFPLPLARKSGCLLLWENENGGITKKTKKRIIFECKEQQENHLNLYAPSYASLLIEHLMLGGLHELAFELLNSGENSPFNYHQFFAGSVYFHCIRTVEALVLAANGEIEKSKGILKQINPQKFNFNDDKYYGCFYIILRIIHGELDSDNDLKKLVAQTGYVRFFNLLKLYTSQK